MVVTVPYNIEIVFYKDGARSHSHRFSGHSKQQVLHAQIDVSRGTVSVCSKNSSPGPDSFPTTCLPVGPAGLFKYGQTPMEPSTSNPFLGQVPPSEVPLRPPPNVTTPQSRNTPASGKDRKEQKNSQHNATTEPQADRSTLPPNIASPNTATPNIASLSFGSPAPEPNTINNTYNLVFYPDSNARGAVNFNMVGNGANSEEINGISDKEGNGVSGGNVTEDIRDDDFISAISRSVFGRYTCVACQKDIKPMRRLNKCGHDICDKDARNIPIVWNDRFPSCRENVWDDSVEV
ncbi:hypothetical protein BS50DRAFT_592174 [Corynespora cassiicola Philippines]|uniref:Uncharacterized protein n=1 Tax=Corynespora cassiicola Philippines TaxID=1448308 RepID=A0A2T2N8Y8_CORCC|nr:hypothetical protein BS50DRAFT_592174 [Corynespora cassiicola Philippines]